MTEKHTYSVTEIFYSLQGEGRHTGMPAVFVRFSGCNLRCPFCDTDFAAQKAMTAENIAAEVAKYPTRHVILTGGEPLLQVDARLTDALHAAGLTVHVETNGTVRPAPGVRIDWLTCSPKKGSDVVLAPDEVDELKVVLTDDVDPQRWADRFNTDVRYLQPCSCGNTAQVVEYVKQYPQWRLSLQTHKYIDIP